LKIEVKFETDILGFKININPIIELDLKQFNEKLRNITKWITD